MTAIIDLAAITGIVAIAAITWGIWALCHLYDDDPVTWQTGALVPGPRPGELGQLLPVRPVPPAMHAAIFVYSVRAAIDRAAVPCLAPGWVEQATRAAEAAALAGAPS